MHGSAGAGRAPWHCSAGTHTAILPAIVLCAGHNLPNKTTDLCLWVLLTIFIPDHPSGFVLVVFFDQARQSEIFPVFCQIVKKSSVQNLEVLLLIFSHTDSKEIISSLICVL